VQLTALVKPVVSEVVKAGVSLKDRKNKRELLILKEDYLSFYRRTNRNSSGAWKEYCRARSAEKTKD